MINTIKCERIRVAFRSAGDSAGEGAEEGDERSLFLSLLP